MIEAVAIAFTLLLLRVASFVAFLAPLSGGSVPKPVKIGLAVALTCVWGPVHAPQALPAVVAATASSNAWLYIAWMAVREVLIGIGLAWVLGLVFVPIRIAGAYIAQEMGLTMAGLTSPFDQQSSSVIAQVLEAVGTIAFFAVDAQHVLLRAFAALLQLAPPGSALQLPDREWLVGCVAGAERMGLEIAAPVAIGLFMTLILLLFVMRTAPQFNLFSFGMQIRLFVGLLLLLLLMPDIIQRMVLSFQHLNRF